MRGLDPRASAAARGSCIGVGTEDDDGFDLAAIERQEISLVLQQYDSLAGHVKGHGIAGRIVGGGRDLLRPIEELHGDHQSQQPADFFIEGGLGDLAGLKQRRDGLGIEAMSVGHLQVQAAVQTAQGVVGGAPVGNLQALEMPHVAQTFYLQVLVGGTVGPVDQVVGGHDAPGPGFLNAGRKVGR